MKRYFRLWYLYSVYSTQIGLQSRFGAILFMIGKFLRFGMFLFFILILSTTVKEIAGYTLWQMIFIFATFNFIDVTSQLVFREVYHFRNYVVNGEIDYFLIRPVIPLFKFLFGGADVLDLPLFFVSIGLLIISVIQIGNITMEGISLYILLLVNSFVIVTALNILILSVGILTTEVDNTLFLYRDLISMGRVPINLYKSPLRGIITFIIPIGLMITFPAQAAFGTLLPQLVIVSLVIGIFFFVFASFSWRFSLRRYSSASS